MTVTEEQRERHRRKCREWYARNIEAERARKLAYRNQNIDEARRKSIAYNRANLPRLAAIARTRRAKAKAGGRHTEAEVADIFKMQKGRCAYCRIKLGKCYHVDHIVALANGGRNDRANLQVLCVACNKSKSAKCPIAFAQSRGFLL